MTLRRILLWGATAGLVLLLATCSPRWLWGPRLVVMELRPRDLVQTLVVNGRVLAPRLVQVGVQATGLVARRLVQEGDRIQEGQLLLQLDPAEFQASLGQAQAGLAQVREVDQPTTRSLLAQADSTLRQAQWTQTRHERLRREGILSQSQLEDSLKTLELARAARASAQAQARSAQVGSGLRLAEANVAFARARLAQTQVVSPAKGTVLTRLVEVGDQVQPGKLLFTVALDEPLQLLVQPDERNLAQLRLGQEARASTDAFPDRPFAAKVSYVAPGVDVTRGTVDVKLDLPVIPDYLRPDMTVSVEIRFGELKGTLAVPLQALRTASGPCVLLLRAGVAVRVPVTLGMRGEREVEVKAGLVPGDLILLDARAKEGQRCRADLKPTP